MAQPSMAGVTGYNDPILQGLSVTFRNDDLLYSKLAPLQSVASKSATYIVEDHDYWFRLQQGAKRGVENPYVSIGTRFHSRAYDCEEIGFQYPLPRPVQAASQIPLNLRQHGLAQLVNQVELALEKEAASAFFTTGKWSSERNGHSGASVADGNFQHWSVATSDPISDVEKAGYEIHQITGKFPDQMVIGLNVFYALKKNPKVLASIFASNPNVDAANRIFGVGSPDTPAGKAALNYIREALGLEVLMVGSTIEETMNEGLISRPGRRNTDPVAEKLVGSRSLMWGNHGLLMVRDNPGLMSRIPAAFLIWDEGGSFPWGVQSGYDFETRRDIDLMYTWPCPVIYSPASGYFFNNVAPTTYKP